MDMHCSNARKCRRPPASLMKSNRLSNPSLCSARWLNKLLLFPSLLQRTHWRTSMLFLKVCPLRHPLCRKRMENNLYCLGILSDLLKSFLEQNLPTKNRSKMTVGVSEDKIGSSIQEALGCTCVRAGPVQVFLLVQVQIHYIINTLIIFIGIDSWNPPTLLQVLRVERAWSREGTVGSWTSLFSC